MNKKLQNKTIPTTQSKSIQNLHPNKKVTTAHTNGNLLNLAFNNSLQANIITTVSNGDLIMVNKAALKLLGYTKKALLAKSRSAIFDINDSNFKKMLKEISVEGQSNATVTGIKSSGKKFPCEISSAVFIGENGIEKAITTLFDLSQKISNQKKIDDKKEKIVADNIDLANAKQFKIDCKKEKKMTADIKRAKAKSDARLAENNAWIKYIAKTSYDVMWDWDIATNKIYVGDSLTEVFGFGLNKNTITYADFISGIPVDEVVEVENKLNEALQSVKKSWSDTFKILRKDGTIATTISRASIVRDENRQAIRLIGAIQDISRLQTLQQKLEDQISLKDKDSETFFLATKVSFDVIWDWDLETDQVFRGEGYEELFGYNFEKEKGNVADWSKHIHPDDREAVEQGIITARQSTDVSWEHTFRFIRQDGTVATVFDRANIFRHADGKAYRMIGALQDISRQKELEEKLAHEMSVNENLLEAINKNFKALAKSSDINLHQLAFNNVTQPNIISAAATGKIQQVNSATCKLLGYTKKELLSKNCSDVFDTKTSSYKKMLKHRMVEGYTSAFVNATKKNGKSFACEISSAVFLDEYAVEKVMNSFRPISQGISNIEKTQSKPIRSFDENKLDAPQKLVKESYLSEVKRREKLLKEYEDSFRLIFNLSSDILYDEDIKTKIIIVSDAFEKELGYTIDNHTLTMDEMFSYIHPEEKQSFQQEYERMLASQDTEWKYPFRFIRADQTVVFLLTSGIVLRDANGKAYRRIGYLQDLNKQRVTEENIEKEIMIREQQIEAATLDAKEQERSNIGKELHDNVNQLLGASKMYLEMAKRGGDNSEMYLNRSSQYTMTAIEEIRKLTKGLASDYIKNLGLIDSIDILVKDNMEMNDLKIFFTTDKFDEKTVDDQFKLNIYRIVQEQLNNILKHANANEMTISLSQNQYAISLIVSDDGVGFDTYKKSKGIGLGNIRSRAISYNGTADFISQPGQGCVLAVKFILAGNAHYKLINVPSGRYLS